MPKRKKAQESDRGARRSAAAAREEEERSKRESGLPGGGKGRRDAPGRTGVYPASASERPPGDAEIRTQAAWGQGERGAEGYQDAGGSELILRDGQLLGGLTAGPSGEPTIDIHGGDRPPREARESGAAEPKRARRKGRSR